MLFPGRYNYMWFKPTIANEKVSDEELARALEETKALGRILELRQVAVHSRWLPFL